MSRTSRTGRKDSPPEPSPTAVAAFESRTRGRAIRPGDEEYDEARRVWNGMIDRRPALVVRCSGVADVVEAVAFAREHELPLAVRGGGHNVSGNAVCDDGLVVDLSEMNGVRVDSERRTVRVEGGATLGDVDRETQLFGLATPLGVVSQTGVAGLTLNGGLGHLRRLHGLASDNLVSVDVVTAAGDVVTASEERNADLFWAVRGGGGNFGVVTSFEYRLHEVGPEVYGLFVWYTGEEARTALDRFREYVTAAPERSSALAFAAFVPPTEEFPEEARGEFAVVFLGCYAGDVDEGEAEFRPLRESATPVVDFSGPLAYTNLQSLLDADYPDGLRYYWKSVYVDAFDDDIAALLVEYGQSAPSELSTVDLWHLGGAIDDLDPDQTAFAHRNREFMLTFEANWENPDDDDANVSWAREGIAAVRTLSVASGGYGNFPGFHEDPSATVFGENYDRLVEVKTRYDPTNLFRLNANVEPSVG